MSYAYNRIYNGHKCGRDLCSSKTNISNAPLILPRLNFPLCCRRLLHNLQHIHSDFTATEPLLQPEQVYADNLHWTSAPAYKFKFDFCGFSFLESINFFSYFIQNSLANLLFCFRERAYIRKA